MTTEVDDAYAAGLIDGEGSIQIKHGKGRHLQLAVQVSNTNKEVLEWLQGHYGSSIHTRSFRAVHRRVLHDLTVTGADVTEMLQHLLPFMIVKQEEAEIAIQYPHWTRKGATVAVPKEVLQERQELAIQLLAQRESQKVY